MMVPWNASWSGEAGCEIRPCRYAGGALATWQPFNPGVGKPLFAKPHLVRQRKSIAEYRCTVCGKVTVPNDRWTFGHGALRDGLWITQEAPVHRRCADLASRVCPEIKKRGLVAFPWPWGARIAVALVGGAQFEADFGVSTHGRKVVGSMKFYWDGVPCGWLRPGEVT